jgi:hypothetical protein
LLVPLLVALVPSLTAYALAGNAEGDIEGIAYAVTLIYTYAGACFGCWGFPLPTLVLGLLSIRQKSARPFFVAFLIVLLVSIAIFLGGVAISTDKGWDMDIL